jgi:hypothetical protein
LIFIFAVSPYAIFTSIKSFKKNDCSRLNSILGLLLNLPFILIPLAFLAIKLLSN